MTVLDCELQDAGAVRHVIRSVRPDGIFHPAAQSIVPTTWIAPAATLQNNTISQLNILEAVGEVGLDPIIQIAG